MDAASAYAIGVPLVLLLVFGVIVARTYHPKRKLHGEEPKYRMMEDEQPKEGAKEDRDVRRR